jgi:hypothetical protein
MAKKIYSMIRRVKLSSGNNTILRFEVPKNAELIRARVEHGIVLAAHLDMVVVVISENSATAGNITEAGYLGKYLEYAVVGANGSFIYQNEPLIDLFNHKVKKGKGVYAYIGNEQSTAGDQIAIRLFYKK